MAFQSKQYPGNRQKTPEQVRPISEIATEIFNTIVRPQYYNGAENLKAVVRAVVAPDVFDEPKQSPVADALVQGIMRSEVEEQSV